MTRAKFTCQSVKKMLNYRGRSGDFMYEAEFSAITDGSSEENKEFWDATPCGTIKISTIKKDHFEVGKDYYVDFTLAE